MPFCFMALLFLGCGNQSGADPESKKGDAGETLALTETDRINAFFDEAFDTFVDRSPMFQTSLGIKKDYDKWDDISDARAREDLALTRQFLERLRQFDYDALDEQTKVSYQMFESQSQNQIDGFRYRFHNYPVTQMFGLHTQMPAFLINFHRVGDESDARAYIARLNGAGRLFDQMIEGLRIRAEKGVIPPKFTFPHVLGASRNVISGQPFDDGDKRSALLQDFTGKLDGLKDLAAETRDAMIVEAETALREVVGPSYEKLIAYLIELEKKATTDDGVWKLPDGAAYYNFALENTTTTKLTAAEIHEIGLAEVARIHGEMRGIMKRVNFKSDDLQEFFQYIKTDPKFVSANTDQAREAYLAKVMELVDGIKGRLDELFITKPKADMEVKRVEPFREATATLAFYQQPAPDGSRPGTYYVNLHDMADLPDYQMAALAYHEGIPGHHMQIAIGQELGELPKFRRFGNYTAYAEGWGLYSELLPKEMGLYQDPYSDFGRLSMEIWRACRLVVDTGIHAKKWTRRQALDYVLENTAQPEGDCVKEIERYIVIPGQATGYKIGMLKILELREKASKQLAERFDIRQFHEVILANGAVPLNVLEQLVDEWIKDKS